MTGRRSAATTDRADPTSWPTVAWPTLSRDQQRIFRAREEAVRLYCRRVPLRTIETATGVSFSTVRRLYERCLQTHADGRLQGLRALVPYEHVKSYRRSATSVRSGPAGKAGAFQQLLERHPELEALIAHELQAHHVVLREGPKGLVVSGLSALHKRFRLLCLELGLTQRDYPLVQDEQGIRSLAAAVKSIATRSFELAARAALAQKRSGGVRPNAEGLPLVATIPFDAVEFDGHRVDVRLRIVFERVAGIEESFEIDRVWLLTIIDICSRAILGYHIVLEPEYSRFDVLKTVERALVPWRPPTLSIPGLRYAPGAGMPSERFPELGYAVWNWFRFDNAKANLAEDTLRALTDIVGCGAHAGPAYRPNERPHIERFFGTLASVQVDGDIGIGSEEIRQDGRHLAQPERHGHGQPHQAARMQRLLTRGALGFLRFTVDARGALGDGLAKLR
jgi:transposase InsO family protein